MSDLPIARPIASSSEPPLPKPGWSSWPIGEGTVGRQGGVQRLGARRLSRLRSNLSDRDLAVLTSVGELRLATSRHLEALHYADAATPLTAARKARRALSRLVSLQLLQRLERQIGGLHAGSVGFIYALTDAGRRLLDEPGTRRRVQEPSWPFVAHTLAVADLFVQLWTTGRDDSRVELLDLQTEPVCWRGWTNLGGGAELLRPDLYLAAGIGLDEVHWFIEVDRGTEHRPALARKCQAYQAYYERDVEQARDGVFPMVAWVVPDARRAAVVAGVVTNTPGLDPALFTAVLASEAVLALLA